MNKKLDHKYPKRSHAYTTVAVLTVANVIAFIDRQIPAMLVGPIKQDFGLSDSQVALLIGAAFSVFYAVMALPIGYAVDRLRRNQVLGVGIFVWSFMTMSAVFATSYAKLFGARMGVAAGEASIAPTSVSLVSDSFPENQRGKAMGVITAGVYIGVGISLWGGGYLIDYLTRIGGLSLPLIGDVKPWQAVFLIAGLPGFLLSAVVFLMPEPGRSGAANAPSGKTFGKDLLIHINQHRQTLLLMFSGLVFMAIIFYS
ncbi:MAG: MFS transporter, partial [Porticoccaceae bacterium]|nr:MFS transporter [Porticoccaceae bacterium]